jgi:putative ABC transport system substrate-binding protein
MSGVSWAPTGGGAANATGTMRRRALIAAGLSFAALPAMVRARPRRDISRLAWFTPYGGFPHVRVREAWRAELSRHGLLEGRNLELRALDRWHGDMGRLGIAIADMIAWAPDVILAENTFGARRAQGATRSIPIVFVNVADPVAVGIVRSISHPGGNITGVTVHNLTLFPKRLQLIRELLPNARRVALLIDSVFTRDGFPAAFYRELHDVAKRLELELVEEDLAQSPDGLDEAFRKMARIKPDIVLPLGPWPSVKILDMDFAKFQDRHGLPVMGFQPLSAGPQDGLLVQMGGDIQEMISLGAAVVSQVLSGASPSDIPVQQQTRIVLVINQKTARSFEIAVPSTLLKRADRVIG